MENPFIDKPIQKKPSVLIRLVEIVAVVTLLILAIWIIILEQNQVNGPSMQPNFFTGEFLLSNRIPKYLGNDVSNFLGLNYHRGDVVVFQVPGKNDFVKRVIGLPGERISIKSGFIFINGDKLTENYLPENLYTEGGDFIREDGEELIIPKNHYALIGDNRPMSNDSRFFEIGFARREWIKGKVLLRIWPFDKFSLIRQGSYSL